MTQYRDQETIINALTEKIEQMEREHEIELNNSYRRGFNEGLRIELHLAIADGEKQLSSEEIKELRLTIKDKIVDGFEPILPGEIIKWVRDCVHKDYLKYTPKFGRGKISYGHITTA